MTATTQRNLREVYLAAIGRTVPVGAVVLTGTGMYIAAADGQLVEILPGGHPRPGCAHAVAR